MDNRRKLFLHIGAAKTGSTSLQRYFHNLPGDGPDPETGFWYVPRPGNRFAHHLLTAALDDPLRAHEVFAQVVAPLADAPPGTTALISGEGLSRHDPDDVLDAMEAVLGLSDPWEVWVLVYVRPHISFLLALYQQIVKAGMTDESLITRAEMRPAHNTCANLQRYAARLNGRVIMRPFLPERLVGGDTVLDTLSQLTPHLRQPLPAPVQQLWRNTGISAPRLALMRAGWQRLGYGGPDPKKRRLIEAMVDCVGERIGGLPDGKLHLGADDLRALKAAYLPDARCLDKRYLHRPLFEAELMAAVPGPETTKMDLGRHFDTTACVVIAEELDRMCESYNEPPLA